MKDKLIDVANLPQEEVNKQAEISKVDQLTFRNVDATSEEQIQYLYKISQPYSGIAKEFLEEQKQELLKINKIAFSMAEDILKEKKQNVLKTIENDMNDMLVQRQEMLKATQVASLTALKTSAFSITEGLRDHAMNMSTLLKTQFPSISEVPCTTSILEKLASSITKGFFDRDIFRPEVLCVTSILEKSASSITKDFFCRDIFRPLVDIDQYTQSFNQSLGINAFTSTPIDTIAKLV